MTTTAATTRAATTTIRLSNHVLGTVVSTDPHVMFDYSQLMKIINRTMLTLNESFRPSADKKLVVLAFYLIYQPLHGFRRGWPRS